jgi:cytochrome oxidase Cu insertion factor (SCO1/SenC/PrrC family)
MPRSVVILLTLSVALAVVLGVTGYKSWTAWSRVHEDTDLELDPVADFSLINQEGRTVTGADLRGKVWVASFLFTRCCSGCPQVSANLAQLQHDLADQDGVVLVSFSVDPDHDTPAVLKAYAESHGADPQRWWLLTGEREPLYKLIQESFHLGVEENQGAVRTPGNEVTHSTRLVLVDRQGRIRGYFEGRQVDEQGQPTNGLSQLKAKLAQVAREKR